MNAKCIGCRLSWRVSPFQEIPKDGYICPRCASKLKAGESLKYCKQEGDRIKRAAKWEKRKEEREKEREEQRRKE